jgi:hypothetical protein
MARSDSAEDVFARVAFAVVVLAVLAAVLIAQFLIGIFVELVKLHRDHAGSKTPFGTLLRAATGVLLVILVVCSVFALVLPTSGAGAAVVAAWSFLAYVVVVETASFAKKPQELPDNLDAYLDWGNSQRRTG